MPLNVDQPNARLPKLAVAAVVVAFLWTAASLLLAFHIVVLGLVAVVPATAGISILRQRVWGAYGLALFLIAQTAITPLLLLRSSAIPTGKVATLIIFDFALAVFFFLAGRSLARSGARKGWMFPWIVASGLSTLPFFFFQAFVIPTSSMENTLVGRRSHNGQNFSPHHSSIRRNNGLSLSF